MHSASIYVKSDAPLASFLNGRDNNLNLLRILAALAVLISHAYALKTGSDKNEPLVATTGLSLGQYAVAVFFSISGLLIARSYDRSVSVGTFIAARFLRLWPALAVALILSAFILGPLVTEYSAKSYFSSFETWIYVPSNLTLLFRRDVLPGVFVHNPLSIATNGSLWSLFYEVSCYVMVFILGHLGVLKSVRSASAVLITALGLHVFSLYWHPESGIRFRIDLFFFVALPFFIGMYFYVAREKIYLRSRYVVLFITLCLLLSKTLLMKTMMIITLSYTSMIFAYKISGKIRRYNSMGDYSYGLYIYAFPIQQLLLFIYPGQNVFFAICATLLCSGLIAILSWHLIERPALANASTLGSMIDKILSAPPASKRADTNS